jgi:enamine deaminase RidA (YjgF/YER057c/UK114 family)
MQRRVINPWTWQDQLGFVQANEITGAQRMLVCSGQTSVDENGTPVHVGDMAGQISKALDNLETVLTQAGYELRDIVRLNVYTTDVDAFFQNYQVVASRLAGVELASTVVGVTRLALPELLVELEATAVK